MPRFGNVEYEKRERVAILTLDEPAKLNSLTPEIRKGLFQSLEEVEKDEEVKVAIITGTGRAFCAGFDIATLQGTGFSPAAVKRMLGREFFDLVRALEKHPKPFLAAVNGLCLGGGLEIAISCDIIIASDKAEFGVPEIKIGVLPGFAIARLHQIVGKAKAKEMEMTGDSISAEEAYRINMVNKVVPHEKLMEEAMALATTISERPAIAVRQAKSAVNRELGGDDYTYAQDSMPFLFATEDAKEGMSAFLEKRKAEFKDR